MNQVDNKGLFRCSGHQSTLDSPAVATKKRNCLKVFIPETISNAKLGQIEGIVVFCVQRARPGTVDSTANCGT